MVLNRMAKGQHMMETCKEIVFGKVGHTENCCLLFCFQLRSKGDRYCCNPGTHSRPEARNGAHQGNEGQNSRAESHIKNQSTIVPIKHHSISSLSYSPQLQWLLYIFFIGADSVIKRVGVVDCEIEMLIYAFSLLRISLSSHWPLWLKRLMLFSKLYRSETNAHDRAGTQTHTYTLTNYIATTCMCAYMPYVATEVSIRDVHE